jgi:ATP-dependent Clp protease ATP-binding subunit ClpC
MFNKFTERARKVILLAKQEAKRFNHDYIGTEHILLGLLREGEGVAAAVLQSLGMNLNNIRLEVEKLVQVGPSTVVSGDLPFTPKAKKVMELAMEEARTLGHNYIGTEHLLLGLIREGEGVASQVFMNMGLDLEKVREEVIKLLGSSIPGAGQYGQRKKEVTDRLKVERPDLGEELTISEKDQKQPLLKDIIQEFTYTA